MSYLLDRVEEDYGKGCCSEEYMRYKNPQTLEREAVSYYYPFKIGTKFQELFSFLRAFVFLIVPSPPLHVGYNVACLVPGCELIGNHGKNKYTMCFTQTLQHYLPALSFL